MRKCFTTLTDGSYSKMAEITINSFLKHNKDYDAVVYTWGEVLFKNKNIRTVRMDDNPIYKKPVSLVETLEMNRPMTHLQLLKEYDVVVYADSDILFMDKIKDDYDQMAFTPHLINPHNITDKVRYIIGGFINIGFYVLPKTPDTIKWLEFLVSVSNKQIPGVNFNPLGRRYWQQTIYQFLPWMGLKYHLIDDPGVNVAYWNLCERKVSYRDGKYFIGEKPMIFYHFSGMLDDRVLSRYDRSPVPNPLDKLYTKYFFLKRS